MISRSSTLLSRRAAMSALAVCSLGLVACTLEGTTDVPGQVRRFDPVAALPAVTAYAGAGAQLVKLEARYVREDGTQDLEAGYVGTSTVDTYQFVRPNTEQVDPSVPVGARKPPAPFESVVVDISKPHSVSQSVNGQQPQTKKHKGMGIQNRGATTVKETVAAAPACRFADLWNLAKAHGAPAGAVASIKYDATGYELAIDGAGVKLRFNPGCQLVP